MTDTPKDRIIIALDVKDRDEAAKVVSGLKDARTFKVGLELFTAEGPALFKKLKVLRKDIFLDLKLHDIPNTVAGAVAVGRPARRPDDDRPHLRRDRR